LNNEYSWKYVSDIVSNFIDNGIDTKEEWEELRAVCTNADPEQRPILYSTLEPCFTMAGNLDYLFSLMPIDEYEVSHTDTSSYIWTVRE